MGKKNYAFINKDMLVWARSETPFASDLEALSLHLPKIVTIEKIKRWEAGIELPSINEAKALAKIYKLPFASFYLSEKPARRPKLYKDRRTALGTEYGEMSYELWEEITRICADRDTILEYYNEASHTTPSLPKVDENDNVETVAAIIRKYFNLPVSFKYKKEYGNNSFNYFRDNLENHSIIVTQISSVPLREMKGLSIFEDEFPIIAINNKDYERAKTFSLFHEVAHLVRRSSSLCLIDDDERNDDEEKLCDRIATEVLMDRNEFLRIASSVHTKYGEWNYMSLISLADRFGVSTIAAFRRLHDLKIISNSQYYEMYKAINADFNEKIKILEASRAGKNIPIYYHVKYINKHGYLFPRIIATAQSEGRITIGEACKIMNIKSKYYGDIVKTVMM